MKHLILHDTFHFQGGGERVALEMARALESSIITAHFDPSAFDSAFLKGISPESLNAYNQKLIARVSKTGALWRAFSTMRKGSADYIWFSGQISPLAHRRMTGTKIMYCHTPPRILYDLKEHYLERTPAILRPAYSIFLKAYQAAYEEAAQAMDLILANSRTVQNRIKQHLGLESTIVYPPCGEGFKWIGQHDYYLSTARLDSLKRVELIVEAFLEMPDKKLVVVSGGPCEARLRQLSSGADNISIEGFVSQDRLLQLMGNCIASIYIPKAEDFGMSPVESMAAGKPVIGVDDGGVGETIKDQITGLLLPKGPTSTTLRKAVLTLTPQRAISMRPACEKRAQRFSLQSFQKRLIGQLTNSP